MINDSKVKGKKLMLIGGLQSAIDLVNLCHRNHVSLGVTDYNKDTIMKKAADEAFDVSAMDVPALIKLCNEEGYSGVITEYVDRLLPVVADVAEGIGAYSPFTKEQIRLSTDKEFFKQTCLKYGVPVPKQYEITSEENIEDDDIEYPVMVKPVDNSSSRGIVVCRNAEELKAGLKTAKASSHTGKVIVEAYLPYDEINITYIAQDGDVQLAAIHDRYFNESQEGVMKVPDLYIYPSRYTDLYYEKVNDTVINMLKEINIKNGSLFMQAVVHDGYIYIYEAGMRLNGCKTYEILEYENNYNTLEHLMHYCLTGSMGEYQKFNARFKKWYATWNVVGIPGMICDKYENEKMLTSCPWLINIGKRYAEGEKVREGSAGTLIQLIARIHIMADTKEELLERLDYTQKTFNVYNEHGESVILPGHSIDELRGKIDYDL